MVLTAKISQSDYLPPVTPDVAEQVQKAEKQPFIEWFPVPKWMSGEWTKDGDLTISETDLRSRETVSKSTFVPNKMTRRFGHRMDKEGNIWWAVILPVENDGNAKGGTARFVTTALACENESNTDLVTRVRYLVTVDQGWGNQQQFQQEALNHYEPQPNGQLRNRSSNRVFNIGGKPMRDAMMVSNWRRTGNFENVERLQNIDLEKSLNLYLHTRGMTNLMTKPLVGDAVASAVLPSINQPGSASAEQPFIPGSAQQEQLPMPYTNVAPGEAVAPVDTSGAPMQAGPETPTGPTGFGGPTYGGAAYGAAPGGSQRQYPQGQQAYYAPQTYNPSVSAFQRRGGSASFYNAGNYNPGNYNAAAMMQAVPIPAYRLPGQMPVSAQYR